ncbi:hypothetical protein Vse01_44710 [Micromonospora sediminimaris]|uniref:Uncharacterized protein n=1 Tax=Micromonospora sediminimaris TaxID=547162 RepID=A0A9W5UVW1_9ACTN|nr:hypothetical protein Vse01_44710 [Micromonospora sediminimaris]
MGGRSAISAPSTPPPGWQARPAPDGSQIPFALILLNVVDGAITGIVTYLRGVTGDPYGRLG